jgi:hypothetical protein
MVAVVLLTTLLTPLLLRAAYQLKSRQDMEDGLGVSRTIFAAHETVTPPTASTDQALTESINQ